jgi:hypothetical protein
MRVTKRVKRDGTVKLSITAQNHVEALALKDLVMETFPPDRKPPGRAESTRVQPAKRQSSQ